MTILVLGAGLSSGVLISYLLQRSTTHQWRVRVGDKSLAAAQQKIGNHPAGSAFAFSDMAEVEAEVLLATTVVSMLPPALHDAVAGLCLRHRRHLVTASYCSPAMAALHNDAQGEGLTFLTECGLDPGIDHLSAVKELNELRSIGARIISFQSYCGGLVAPESDNNPWHYKLSWNPRNVVLAGAAGPAVFRKNGTPSYTPYHRLFKEVEAINIEGYGEFEGYPNRNSLTYEKPYGLENAETIVRGTLRKQGFCNGWAALVDLGLTDDNYTMTDSANATNGQLLGRFTSGRLLANLGINANAEALISWLGLSSNEAVLYADATPAQWLQRVLETKWALAPGDKDMIAMQHLFEYELDGRRWQRRSSLVHLGDEHHTAMAKTVGLPAAMAAEMIATGAFTERGVLLPLSESLYNTLLPQLAAEGIAFTTTDRAF